jgi:hypothetical protein
MTQPALPVTWGRPPVLALVLLTAAAECEDEALVELSLEELVVGAGVMVEGYEDEVEFDALDELLLELCDDEKLLLDDELDEEEVVEEAVVGRTKFPAVTVRICPPISDAPLNVVVEEVAVEVMVPSMAFTDLLQTPWSTVTLQPTSIVPETSSDDCAECVYA